MAWCSALAVYLRVHVVMNCNDLELLFQLVYIDIANRSTELLSLEAWLLVQVIFVSGVNRSGSPSQGTSRLDADTRGVVQNGEKVSPRPEVVSLENRREKVPH